MPSPLHRLARALVRLLPAAFRYDFGDAIRRDLDDRHRAGDRAGLVRRELPGLLAAIVREHTEAFVRDVR